MSAQAQPTPCSHRTRRGRPCRNPAAPGTRPPACRRHRGRPNPAQGHFYFYNPTADESQALQTGFPGPDLQPEIDLVRIVLRRLMGVLDDPTAELSVEETRRLAGVVFSGARTVALLIDRHTARAGEMRQWLAEALVVLGDERGIEL
ncbi:MAG: hypothetical protein KBF17_07840 [Candidatus Promineofilum sp.]|nr:hypothetical protein [Promineifilum sp.]